MNRILGKWLEIADEDIQSLPRMRLMSGRTNWSDLSTLKQVIQHVGCLCEITYGTVKIVLDCIDLRDPPKHTKAEEEDVERIRLKLEAAAREKARTRRQRPKGRKKGSGANSPTRRTRRS